MSNSDTYLLLAGHFDNKALAHFDEDPGSYSQHESHVAEVARKLQAAFQLPILFGLVAWDYRSEFGISVWLDKAHRAVPAHSATPSTEMDADVQFCVELEVSLKGPFVTFTSWRRSTQNELDDASNWRGNAQIVGWKFNREIDLFPTVEPWIDWLCTTYGLTYIPHADLEEEVPGRVNECTFGPATLYSIMFREN